jgi:hypothetical protein
MKPHILLMILSLALAAPQALANKLIEPGPREKIAKGGFSAAPEREWNRLDEKEGKYQEIWTLDGDQLNKVTFYGGVPVGAPLFKEHDKKNQPLPKVADNMLITDIPVLLENTYRTLSPGTRFTVGTQAPAEFSGEKGIRFAYTFVDNADEVERRGEAFGAFRNGKLYLISYEAPAIYFYEKDIENFRQVVRSTTIRD